MRFDALYPTAAALLLLARLAAAQTSSLPPWSAAVDSVVQREMERTKPPGAQIAIVERGRLAYTKAYGLADIETGRAVTDRTLFQTGSVQKLITAAMLAQLAADGVVDLRAPVSRYVTELAGRRVGAVTVHELLTHSAGWRDGSDAFGRLDDIALGDVFRAVTDTMIMTEAGRVPSYSNPGFSMAGYVAERATGRRYSDLADSLIFRKMGMPRATLRPTQAMTYDFSQGHVGPLDQTARVQHPMPVNAADWPSGFSYASAAELARLAIALMNGGTLDGKRVLADGVVRTMTTGHVPIPGARALRYGYGMTVDSVGGRRVWQKSGVVTGFSALVTMWPDEQFAIVVLANRDVLLPRRVTPLLAQIAGRIAPPPAVTYDTRDVTPAERAELAGSYRQGNVTIVVADANGALEVRLARQSFPARMASDGSRLIVGAPGDSVLHPYVIVREPDGRVRFLYRDNSRSYLKQP